MQQGDTSKNNKILTLLKAIWSDLWGLLLMIAVVFIIYLFFEDGSQIHGFITGVICGGVVWIILSRNKHWLYPISYMLIIFAYLVTKRAVDVGIAGFYLDDWYGSLELMLLVSTLFTVILFKGIECILKSNFSINLIKVAICILCVILLFFVGLTSAKTREKELLFSKTSIMMIQQLFNMRADIENILSNEQDIDMAYAEKVLDFNYQNVSVLLESFYPESSGARRFDDFLKDEVYSYLFNYDEGVEQGIYKPNVTDRVRLEQVRDFCSSFAGDLNSANGDMSKTAEVLINLKDAFEEVINQ